MHRDIYKSVINEGVEKICELEDIFEYGIAKYPKLEVLRLKNTTNGTHLDLPAICGKG